MSVKTFPVMEDFYKIKHVSQAAMNGTADGFAWVESTWDSSAAKKADQKYVSSVYYREKTESVVSGSVSEDASGSLSGASDSVLITAGGRMEHSPVFSADGSALYFLSDASGELQVWKASGLRAGQVSCQQERFACKQLTHLRHGVLSFRMSPDESSMLLYTEVWPEEELSETLLTDINREWTDADRLTWKKKKEKQPWIAEDASFKSDADMGYIRKRKNLLLHLELATENLTLIGGLEKPVHMPLWEANSRSFLYIDAGENAALIRCRTEAGENAADERCPEAGENDISASCKENVLRETVFSFRNPGISLYSNEFILKQVPGSNSYVFLGASGEMGARNHASLYLIKEGLSEPIDLLGSWNEKYSADPVITAGAYYGKAGDTWQISEDGASLLFLSMELGSAHLYRLDLTQFLTDGPEPDVEISSEEFSERSLGASASPSFSQADGAASELRILPPEQLTCGKEYFRSITPERNGCVFGVWGDEIHFPEARVFATEKTAPSCRLSNSNHETDTESYIDNGVPKTNAFYVPNCVSDANPWLRERWLSVPKEMNVTTIDGKASIQGWVLPPMQTGVNPSAPDSEIQAASSANIEASEETKKHPALLFVHGGPALCYTTGLNYEFQALSAAGFAVIFANPRGSCGYGKAFADPEPAWDGTTMYDLLHFMDMAIARYDWIDPERLGVCGGSYGGYMTIQMASHTARFKAACAFRPLVSFLIINASSHHAGQGNSRAEYVDYTDKMMADLEKSPIYYADRINIPFQILQSTKDANCPPEQAHQLYVAVKDLHPDLPVQLVLYPDSNHGLLQNGPLYLAVHHCNANLEWFRKYL